MPEFSKIASDRAALRSQVWTVLCWVCVLGSAIAAYLVHDVGYVVRSAEGTIVPIHSYIVSKPNYSPRKNPLGGLWNSALDATPHSWTKNENRITVERVPILLSYLLSFSIQIRYRESISEVLFPKFAFCRQGRPEIDPTSNLKIISSSFPLVSYVQERVDYAVLVVSKPYI